MKNHNLLLITFSIIFLLNRSLFATASTSNALTVVIAHTNPRIYYQGDEIFIDIKITNNTRNEIISLISQDKKYSFDFKLITLNNKSISYSNDYIISFHRVQPVFNSELRLGAKESYTITIKLNDYFNMDVTGQFYLSAVYYPELKRNLQEKNSSIINSSEIPLNIRPRGFQEDFVVSSKSLEQEKMLVAEKKSPPEVIQYTLDARMKMEWEKFFLYIDIEELIKTNYIFKDRFMKSDSEVKIEILKQYKEYLKKNTVDDISFLPHHYKIARADYSPIEGKGKVAVIVYFKHLEFTEQVFYTYFLHKKGDRWLIRSYETMNMVVK